MSKLQIDISDKRWGGYIPWFFRHEDFSAAGNFLLFFNRLSQRFYRLFIYNELAIPNLSHFGSMLESKSLQRYRFDNQRGLHLGIKEFFEPETLRKEKEELLFNDPEEIKLRNLENRTVSIGGYKLPAASKEQYEAYKKLKLEVRKTRATREEVHYRAVFNIKLGVLEVLLRMLPKESEWFSDLVQDIRSYFAESQIMLDINTDSCLIELLEEPLLQKEIIDKLLPRLKSRFPERANEFIKAYHDLIMGKDFDNIFLEAFKTLEEMGRSITNDKNFDFTDSNLNKHFPQLHKTIYSTIIKLSAHRGDKGGHGKSKPEAHEMRYLLFSILNIALLLIDYKP